MALISSTASSLPGLQLLCASPSSAQDRRLVCFYHPWRICKQVFSHSCPKSRRNRYLLVAPCCCASDSDDEPPIYTNSPLLYRLWLRRHPPPKKIYASEFDINYDIYATNSMAGYEPPPPPLVEFDAPWEEYYDERVGDDYIDPNAKPTSSLIKYLEELNEKMVQDDLKAGKPPRKKFPNKDLNLTYDEGPRFLKPRGQASRYYPVPPVMAPLDWVYEGGGAPYVKLPPIVFPKKEEVAATSEASGTNGNAMAESECRTTNVLPLSTEGSATSRQDAVVPLSQPVSTGSGVSPVLQANQISSKPSPTNPSIHEPYQHSVANRLPPESTNQSLSQTYQPYQSANENESVQGSQHQLFLAKDSGAQESQQYQPSLPYNKVSESASLQQPPEVISISQISDAQHQGSWFEDRLEMPAQQKTDLGPHFPKNNFDLSRPSSQQGILVDTDGGSFASKMGDNNGGALPVTKDSQLMSLPLVHLQQNAMSPFSDSGYDSPRPTFSPINGQFPSSVQHFQGPSYNNVLAVDSNRPPFPQAGSHGDTWIIEQTPIHGPLSSRVYVPKEGDTIVGAVISGDDYKLDLEVGAHQPAMMAFRDFQLLIQVDSEDGNFTLSPSEHTTGGFVAPMGRSLLVKGDDNISENIETGTVFVADVQAVLDETTILSCRSLIRRFAWFRIKQVMEIGEPIEIEIMQSNDGGVSGYFEGLRAFLPRSELVERPESTISLKSYIGRMLRVAIIQADEAASNIVISEIKYWMQRNIRLGVVHDVTVTRIHPYGAQMEIKNTRIRGFLHVSTMSKEYVRSVSDLFQEGDSARVMVIKGRNPEMVSFSLAELESEPGLIFRDRMRVYQEADEMARRFCRGLSDDKRQIFLLPKLSGFPTEPPSLNIANRHWVCVGS